MMPSVWMAIGQMFVSSGGPIKITPITTEDYYNLIWALGTFTGLTFCAILFLIWRMDKNPDLWLPRREK
jgi:hypothetical protein